MVTGLAIEIAPLFAGGECAETNTGTLGTPANDYGLFTVYNFQVADWHTYFTAPDDDTPFVWVHNANNYGNSAIREAGPYESRVRGEYGEVSFKKRQYKSAEGGKIKTRVADSVAKIDGQKVAIEAKYVKNWSNSLRNPHSKIGSASFAKAERRNMISQARAYSNNFDRVIYHSNDPRFIAHYSRVFKKMGLGNIEFRLTP